MCLIQYSKLYSTVKTIAPIMWKSESMAQGSVSKPQEWPPGNMNNVTYKSSTLLLGGKNVPSVSFLCNTLTHVSRGFDMDQ